jgi:4-carboxymuconolactone decarboxylase
VKLKKLAVFIASFFSLLEPFPNNFIDRRMTVNKEMFEKGLEIRKSVLGAEYVENSINNATDFNMPMQELVTEYCWGEVWGRPGLERKTRSIINLAMITALNRPHELKLHVRGAINNGLTRDEIKEVFLQTAIYCGVPAAIDSFRSAKEVFDEMDKE